MNLDKLFDVSEPYLPHWSNIYQVFVVNIKQVTYNCLAQSTHEMSMTSLHIFFSFVYTGAHVSLLYLLTEVVYLVWDVGYDIIYYNK